MRAIKRWTVRDSERERERELVVQALVQPSLSTYTFDGTHLLCAFLYSFTKICIYFAWHPVLSLGLS